MSTNQIRTSITVWGTYLVAIFALPLARTPASAHDLPPIFDPPKRYYLSLGDSIAYGCPASTTLSGKRQLFFPIGDNYFLGGAGRRLGGGR